MVARLFFVLLPDILKTTLMPAESDSLNLFVNGPLRQLEGFAQTDTLNQWQIPSAASEHYVPSIFAGHELPASGDVLPIVPNGLLNFGTGVFCFVLLVMAIVFVYQRRKITLLLQSLFSKRVAGQLLRESRIFTERIYLYSMVIMLAVQAFFLLMLTDRFLPSLIQGHSYGSIFALLVLLVAADHYIKYFFATGFANLFDYQSLMNIFRINKFFYITFASFILFPLEIIALYTGSNLPFFAYAVVFLVSYIFMIYNTVSLNWGKVNWLLFFLYFCTLEILPYAVILKFVITRAVA